ncbi:MAG: hypothetical protein HZA48_07635 [Planctomycetes bacterium]|nr:hypothetical protein [Planctomycetota bacterium]
MVKALALLSGGLDSSLAIQIMKQQNIELEALNFITVFCNCTAHKDGCVHQAGKIAKQLGVPIKTLNITEPFIEIVKKPKYGYGKNMNPCIDCRINMLRMAKGYMAESGASFIITGEVLAQRPMSQYLQAMNLIEKEAGLEGLILRPLSAKLLKPTIPEINGWVDREKLLAIHGRSRREQITLAELLELKDYPCPSGGCLLTDIIFGHKIKDLIKHGDFQLNDVHLLKVGRHFRLGPETKIVTGRDERENNVIMTFASDNDVLMEIDKFPGPMTLIKGPADAGQLNLAGLITAHYSDAPKNSELTVILTRKNHPEKNSSMPLMSAVVTQLEELRID